VSDENPSGLGAFDLPLRLPGQYFDKETNTHYNMRRDYDPAIGRYIQSDPIGLRGGLNTYLYVGGDPLRHIDPLGLRALCPPGPKMKKCLEEIFGQSIDGIEVVIDLPMIERHFGPGVEGATTRQGKIYINLSCDRFWGDPEFVLHEHYHVVQQWGNEGMTIPGYLIQFPTKEREAKDFAAKNVNRLKECLLCAEPR